MRFDSAAVTTQRVTAPHAYFSLVTPLRLIPSLAWTRTTYAGGYSGGVPPDPIPNSEVKPSCADGTAWATVWKSRTLPAP